jgi:5-methylcytosine-specific restriction endonuclease McrA
MKTKQKYSVITTITDRQVKHVRPEDVRVMPHWHKLSYKVFIRDNFICSWCKKEHPPKNLTAHHVKYVCEGGKHDTDNLVTLCWGCHRKMHSVDTKQGLYGKKNKKTAYETVIGSLKARKFIYNIHKDSISLAINPFKQIFKNKLRKCDRQYYYPALLEMGAFLRG